MIVQVAGDIKEPVKEHVEVPHPPVPQAETAEQ